MPPPDATMSEEDVEMLGPDGQGSAKVDRDRRAPRFSWTPAYETTFFRSLCESVQLGLRENSSFKAEAWERAAQALQESHGAYPTKSHLINKSDNARKRFRLWRGLREDPEFVYNAKTRTVTATEDAWRAHIEREPLSRALRGRPFDHEDFMEILYPDVIGSGGAPKRIMKPKRKGDGQLGDEGDMPGTGILNLQADSSSGQNGLESPNHRHSLSQTPSDSSAPANLQKSAPTLVSIPKPTPTQTTALTPPDETSAQGRKRNLPVGSSQVQSDNLRSESSTPTGSAPRSLGSPEKRVRQNGPEEHTSAASASVSTLNSSIVPIATPPLLNSTPVLKSDAAAAANRKTAADDVADAKGTIRGARQWQEDAVDLFFRDFSGEDIDLQIAVSQTVLSNEHTAMVFLSYANAAAKGPKQSPEEAAAPQPPEVVPNESASTSSLIDVDVPSVHTVPSDFNDQDVQTETQAKRIQHEAEAAKAKSARAAKKASNKAKKADSWITEQFSKLSDGSAGGVAIANLAAIVGVSSYLGYRAWGLYEKGRLDWQHVGVGAGILAAVGAVEAVLGSYLYRGNSKKNN